jgi:hypothetical protein
MIRDDQNSKDPSPELFFVCLAMYSGRVAVAIVNIFGKACWFERILDRPEDANHFVIVVHVNDGLLQLCGRI